MPEANERSHEERLQRARAVLEHATQVAADRTTSGASRSEVSTDEPAAPEEPERPGRPERPDRRRRERAAQERSRTRGAAVDGEPDQEEVARTVALNLLNHSARSRAQLAEAMARKDVPDAVAERVLDRFEAVGLVDDREYAAMLVRTRQAERGLGRRGLAEELRRKGIKGQAATEALDQVAPDDEAESARWVVEKRLRTMAGLDPEVKRRRLAAMLARKGHNPGVSFRVIDEALAGERG